jgi:hypothetical protein
MEGDCRHGGIASAHRSPPLWPIFSPYQIEWACNHNFFPQTWPWHRDEGMGDDCDRNIRQWTLLLLASRSGS